MLFRRCWPLRSWTSAAERRATIAAPGDGFERSLAPICSVFQAFLTDGDAARLLRVSRGACALLRHFTFRAHAFQPSTSLQLRRCLALYDRLGLCITRLCLPCDFNEPLLDGSTGRPLLPASLVALALGQAEPDDWATSMMADMSRLLSLDSEDEGGRQQQQPADAEGEYEGLLRRVDARTSWRLRPYCAVYSDYSLAIPPGALPAGLRCLQLNDWHEPALQEGSIPASVTVLQAGRRYTQRLSLLGPSITTLLLDDIGSRALSPGELSPSLRWLHVGHCSPALQVGSLPPRLKGLDLRLPKHHAPIRAGVIPRSVTHLRFDGFQQPLQQGLLPDGLQHLHLGSTFDYPIPPHALPTSLRELILSDGYRQPLLPGSLPDGLQLLQLPRRWYRPAIAPGVIPPSVRLILFPTLYSTRLLVGGVPSTVRWVRFPRYYEWVVAERLSPHTEVVWSGPVRERAR